jgi:hypothetical protein
VSHPLHWHNTGLIGAFFSWFMKSFASRNHPHPISTPFPPARACRAHGWSLSLTTRLHQKGTRLDATSPEPNSFSPVVLRKKAPVFTAMSRPPANTEADIRTACAAKWLRALNSPCPEAFAQLGLSLSRTRDKHGPTGQRPVHGTATTQPRDTKHFPPKNPPQRLTRAPNNTPSQPSPPGARVSVLSAPLAPRFLQLAAPRTAEHRRRPSE